MTEAREYFDELARQFEVLPGGSRGQMFGYPVAKVNGKAFMSFYHEDIVFKLDPTSLQEALALSGAHLFDPMGTGRKMKEWVQVPSTHIDIWNKLAVKARGYVLDLLEK
jgi:hypothetical protein